MLDFPVKYHGVDLNTIEKTGEGGRKGCLLEELDVGRSQARGYTEPRAQDDGLDASDVYMGPRYVNLTGVVYGENVGDLHDRLQGVRTALTPTVSYDFDKPDYGYIPLEFVIPTEDRVQFPDGTRPMELRARPVGQPQFTIRRDAGEAPGASNSKGGGIMWRATLECKDPRFYLRPETWEQFTTATSPTRPITNKGDYPAPLNILIVLGAASVAASKIEIDIGNSNMTITPWRVGPPAAGFPLGTIIRYSGELKVLTITEPGKTETLAMDLFTFRNNTTHPKVLPGTNTYAVRLTSVTLGAGTRFMYSESFA